MTPNEFSYFCDYNGFPKLQIRNGVISAFGTNQWYRLTFHVDQKDLLGSFNSINIEFDFPVTYNEDGSFTRPFENRVLDLHRNEYNQVTMFILEVLDESPGNFAWIVQNSQSTNVEMCCDATDTLASDLSMCSVTNSVVTGAYEYTTLDFVNATVSASSYPPDHTCDTVVITGCSTEYPLMEYFCRTGSDQIPVEYKLQSTLYNDAPQWRSDSGWLIQLQLIGGSIAGYKWAIVRETVGQLYAATDWGVTPCNDQSCKNWNFLSQIQSWRTLHGDSQALSHISNFLDFTCQKFENCQTAHMVMPNGWEIAREDEMFMLVSSSFHWDTRRIYAGEEEIAVSSVIENGISKYAVSPEYCPARILIRRGCSYPNQYAESSTPTLSSMGQYFNCTDCPAGRFVDALIFSSRVGETIEDCGCPIGYELNLGVCEACTGFRYKDKIGSATDRCLDCTAGNYIKLEGSVNTECIKCPRGKFGSELRVCMPCAEGTFSNIEGSFACDLCKGCPDQHYMTGCLADTGGGNCFPCNHTQCDLNETLTGCLHTPGHNNASGVCKPSELLQPTAQCPRRVTVETFDEITGTELSVNVKAGRIGTSFGLGGFDFDQVFGGEVHEVDFQCRSLCDGLTDGPPGNRTKFGTLDSGYCDGPFACNVQACTMQAEFGDFRVPRGCPKEIPVWNEAEYEQDKGLYVQKFTEARQQKCQTCDECGSGNSAPGFGRGCAVECSNLLCEDETIYDWTDSAVALPRRCKACDALRNFSLCQPGFESELHGAFRYVSGLEPKLNFENCTAKNGDNIPPSYGQCALCAELTENHNTQCTDKQYHASCAVDGETPVCVDCFERDGALLHQSSFIDASDTKRFLYCQVDSCEEQSTGFSDNGRMCVDACLPSACDLGEMTLPCELPHATRCVPAYPPNVDTREFVSFTAVSLNHFETESSRLFSSFENALVNLMGVQQDLSTCVWNSAQIFDNTMNYGGISNLFYDKECQNTLPSSEEIPTLPLMPLQNVVRSTDMAAWHNLLLDTPTTVVRYSGSEGNDAGFFDNTFPDSIQRPVGGRAQFGDLCARVQLRQALTRVWVPIPPNLPNFDTWMFSAYARTEPRSLTEIDIQLQSVSNSSIPILPLDLDSVDVGLVHYSGVLDYENLVSNEISGKCKPRLIDITRQWHSLLSGEIRPLTDTSAANTNPKCSYIFQANSNQIDSLSLSLTIKSYNTGSTLIVYACATEANCLVGAFYAYQIITPVPYCPDCYDCESCVETELNANARWVDYSFELPTPYARIEFDNNLINDCPVVNGNYECYIVSGKKVGVESISWEFTEAYEIIKDCSESTQQMQKIRNTVDGYMSAIPLPYDMSSLVVRHSFLGSSDFTGNSELVEIADYTNHRVYAKKVIPLLNNTFVNHECVLLFHDELRLSCLNASNPSTNVETLRLASTDSYIVDMALLDAETFILVEKFQYENLKFRCGSVGNILTSDSFFEVTIDSEIYEALYTLYSITAQSNTLYVLSATKKSLYIHSTFISHCSGSNAALLTLKDLDFPVPDAKYQGSNLMSVHENNLIVILPDEEQATFLFFNLFTNVEFTIEGVFKFNALHVISYAWISNSKVLVSDYENTVKLDLKLKRAHTVSKFPFQRPFFYYNNAYLSLTISNLTSNIIVNSKQEFENEDNFEIYNSFAGQSILDNLYCQRLCMFQKSCFYYNLGTVISSNWCSIYNNSIHQACSNDDNCPEMYKLNILSPSLKSLHNSNEQILFKIGRVQMYVFGAKYVQMDAGAIGFALIDESKSDATLQENCELIPFYETTSGQIMDLMSDIDIKSTATIDGLELGVVKNISNLEDNTAFLNVSLRQWPILLTFEIQCHATLQISTETGNKHPLSISDCFDVKVSLVLEVFADETLYSFTVNDTVLVTDSIDEKVKEIHMFRGIRLTQTSHSPNVRPGIDNISRIETPKNFNGVIGPAWRNLRRHVSARELHASAFMAVEARVGDPDAESTMLLDALQLLPLLTRRTVVFKCNPPRDSNNNIVPESLYKMDSQCNYICLIDECDPGHYGPSSDCQCLPCPKGTYFNATISSSGCSNCAAGKYSNYTATTECLNCIAGKYSQAEASSCIDCLLGKYSESTASECLDCIDGKYQAYMGQRECLDCEAGKYQDNVGATECKTCTFGTFSSSPQATSCEEKNCPAGKQSNSLTSDSCACCPSSTYRSVSGYYGAQCVSCTRLEFPGGGGVAREGITHDFHEDCSGNTGAKACR